MMYRQYDEKHERADLYQLFHYGKMALSVCRRHSGRPENASHLPAWKSGDMSGPTGRKNIVTRNSRSGRKTRYRKYAYEAAGITMDLKNKKTRFQRVIVSADMVPTEGFEPPHLAAHGPEPCASTNSATWAFDVSAIIQVSDRFDQSVRL